MRTNAVVVLLTGLLGAAPVAEAGLYTFNNEVVRTHVLYYYQAFVDGNHRDLGFLHSPVEMNGYEAWVDTDAMQFCLEHVDVDTDSNWNGDQYSRHWDLQLPGTGSHGRYVQDKD